MRYLLFEISLDSVDAWMIAALSVVLDVFGVGFFGNVMGADGVWIFGAVAIILMVCVLCSNNASRSFNDISAGSFRTEHSPFGWVGGGGGGGAGTAGTGVDRFLFIVLAWLDGFGGNAGFLPIGVGQFAFA